MRTNPAVGQVLAEQSVVMFAKRQKTPDGAVPPFRPGSSALTTRTSHLCLGFVLGLRLQYGFDHLLGVKAAEAKRLVALFKCRMVRF
jgi:hypothetical protein